MKKLRLGAPAVRSRSGRVSNTERARNVGALIRAVNVAPNLSELADFIQVVLSTALGTSLLRGIRWSDVHLEQGHVMVRSARMLHATCVPIPPHVVARLRARQERRPEDQFVFPHDSIREAEEKLVTVSTIACGRPVTVEDLQEAGLKGWARASSMPR